MNKFFFLSTFFFSSLFCSKKKDFLTEKEYSEKIKEKKNYVRKLCEAFNREENRSESTVKRQQDIVDFHCCALDNMIRIYETSDFLRRDRLTQSSKNHQLQGDKSGWLDLKLKKN